MKRSADYSSSSKEGSGCGLTKSEIYKWMEEVQNSATKKPADKVILSLTKFIVSNKFTEAFFRSHLIIT